MITRRILQVAALLLLAALVGGWLWWRGGVKDVEPPAPDLSGDNDPILAQVIAEARTRILRQPRSAENWGRLGRILMANGIGEDARLCFARAAQLEPGQARWPYLLGLAQQPISPDDAVASFREAARLIGSGPEAGVVRWRYAEALLRKGEKKEAAVLLREVLEAEPDNPRVLLDLGILAADENDVETAETCLLRCVNHPLTRQRAGTRLASLYLQKGDTAKAERYRKEARQHPRDPEGPDPFVEEYKALLVGRRALFLRSEYLLRAGESNEAIQLLQSLIETYPDEVEAYVKLGMALTEGGRYKDAEQVLRRGLARGEDKVQAHYFLCVALFHQAEKSGDRTAFEEAANQARLALAGKPDHAFAHLYLGLALQKLGERKSALHELEEAVRFSPESTDPHLHLGQALVAAGQSKAGFAHLDRAVELAGEKDSRPRTVRERLQKEGGK